MWDNSNALRYYAQASVMRRTTGEQSPRASNWRWIAQSTHCGCTTDLPNSPGRCASGSTRKDSWPRARPRPSSMRCSNCAKPISRRFAFGTTEGEFARSNIAAGCRACRQHTIGNFFEIPRALRGPNGVVLLIKTIGMREHLSKTTCEACGPPYRARL